MYTTGDGDGEERSSIEVKTRYIWEAIYDHGESSLIEWERKENGELVEHVFADIDLPRCTGFILHNLVDGEATSIQVDYESGQRLIFFRRHQSTLNFETGEITKHEPIHVIGWQRTVHDTDISSYVYIFPDGSVLLSDRHDAV